MTDHVCVCCGPHPGIRIKLDGVDVTDQAVYVDENNGFVVLFDHDEDGHFRKVVNMGPNGYLSKSVKFGNVAVEEAN